MSSYVLQQKQGRYKRLFPQFMLFEPDVKLTQKTYKKNAEKKDQIRNKSNLLTSPQPALMFCVIRINDCYLKL